MKKTLSIFLTLVLLISAIISVPLLTKAEGVTAASFTDGVTWTMSDGAALTAGTSWYTVTGANGSVTITQPNFPYRSAYAKITGFTAGKTYEVSFTVPTGIESVRVALDESKAEFSNQALVAKSGYEDAVVFGSISGTTATVTFTAANDYIYLTVKNSTLTTATFNNFAVQTVGDDGDLGAAIANGTWDITKNAGGTVTKLNNTVSFTGAQYQTMYTKITGLTANTTYKLAFDVSPTMEAQVWLLSGDAEVSFTDSVPDGATNYATVNGTKAEVEFTAEETSYYIFFRNALTTGGTTAFTFSNFTFEDTTVSDVNPGEAIADGTWNITKNAGGTVNQDKSAHTVSFTGAQYQTMYTKLTGLTANTTYKLTFDVSPTMDAQVWLLSGGAEVSFNDSVPNGATNYATVNGTKAEVEFTAEETSYYIFFRNALTTGGTTAFTFSNFTFEDTTVSDVNPGEAIADGTWNITKNAGGTVNQDKSAHTVSFTGAQYQAIYTKLTGLTANTEYELSFDSTITTLTHAYLITGGEDVTFNDTTPTNASTTSLNISYDVNTVKIKLTATEETHWIVIRNTDSPSSFTLSNFVFDEASKDDDENTNLADKDWYITKNAGGSVNHNSSAHTVSFTGAQYQAIYTKLTGLALNTNYELVFDSTITTLTHAYLITGSEDVTFNDTTPTNASAKPINIATSGSTVTVKFTATEESHWIVIRNTDSPSSFTLSNMDLIKKEVASSVGNDAGYAISDGTWEAFNPHQTPNVTVDTTEHTVSTTNTYRSIYTKFTAEANTHYTLTFNYSYTGDYNNGVSNVQVVTSNGKDPVYNAETGGLDADKNGVCSSYENDVNTKTIKVEFVTGEGTEYYLSVQTGGFETLTLSDFALEKIATLSAEEAGGSQVVLGEWAAKCSNISIASKDVTTRTITASSTNYHWVIGKITGLNVGQTYKLTFKDELGSSQSVFALPADEDATSDKDYVIDGNGQYTGRYYDNRNGYSSTVKDSKSGLVSVVFTAVMENYHIFIHHQEATSAIYSNITFEKFDELTAEEPTVSTSPKGLRFAFTISKDLQKGFEGLKVKEYGTVSAIAEDLRGEPLVYNDYQVVTIARVKKDIAYSQAEKINDIYSEDADGNKTFTAIITGIGSKNENVEFTVRPYVVLENGAVIYGNPKTCSVKQAK